MKKILSFIFMLLVMLGLTTLTACENPFGPTEEPGPSENNDQTIVDEVANSFSFTTTEVSADFTLKTSAAGGVVITWTSNNAAIAINGQNATVTRPAFADGDVTVTLTATFSKGTATATKTYEVKVLKGEDTTQIQASTVAAAKSVETGTGVTVRGVVSAIHWGTYQNALSAQGFYLTDDTATVYVYSYDLAGKVQVGQEVIISAEKTEYNGITQLQHSASNPATLVATLSSGNKASTAAADTTTTISQIIATTDISYAGKSYIFTDVEITKEEGTGDSGAYTNYRIKAADGSDMLLYSQASGAEYGWLDEYVGKKLSIHFVVNGLSSKNKWRGHVIEVISAEEIQPETEPAHVSTTIADLLASKPTEDAKVIYEVTGVWTLDAGKETYGNGKLADAEGNEIVVYGFSANSSVVTWNVNKYDYKNNKSYSSMGLNDGATVKVGMVYTVQFDNYSIYLIELVENGIAPEPTPDPEPTPGTGNVVLAASIDFNNAGNRTEYDADHQVWVSNGITVTNNKSASTSNVGDYTAPARFYKSSDLIISYTGMVKIVFNCDNYKTTYPTDLQSSIKNGTVTVSGTVVTVVFDAPVDTFTITGLAGQVRVDSIDVYTAAE